jgi:N-acetyl-anhydromuramyl-L-alanine amidase AmpD
VGNFENTVPSAKQLSSLRGVLRFLTDEYAIDASAVAGHGQVSEKHTLCPGKLFFLDEVMKTLG